MPKHSALRIACVLLAPLATTGALAQTPAEQPGEKPPPPPAPATAPTPDEPDQAGWMLLLSPRGEYTFPATLRTSGARASVARAGLGLDGSGPLGDHARLVLAADVEASWYDFKDSATLLPSGQDPFGSVYALRLLPGLAYSLDRQWTVLGGGIVELSGEGGVDFGDAITYGGYVGASYKFSDDLSLTLGVIAKTRLEDDALIAPLIAVHWKIDEVLSLESEGLGARFVGKLNDQFSASVFGRYELRDFRLDDDGSVPGGVVQDERLPLGVALTWSPRKDFSVTLSGGVVVYQRFKFLDSDGNQAASDKTRPAPFISLRAEIRF